MTVPELVKAAAAQLGRQYEEKGVSLETDVFIFFLFLARNEVALAFNDDAQDNLIAVLTDSSLTSAAVTSRPRRSER
jgi:hypothetical protein